MTVRDVWPSAFLYSVRALDRKHFAAQYPARQCPCRRFAGTLAGDAAWLGVSWMAAPSTYGSFIRYHLPVSRRTENVSPWFLSLLQFWSLYQPLYQWLASRAAERVSARFRLGAV